MVCKNHWILSFSGRLSLLRPGYETTNHSRLRHLLMSWEYLALGACSTSDNNSELMPGPHAVLVVDGPDNRPETARLNFRRYTVQLSRHSPGSITWSTPLEACIAKVAHELMTCRHLEYARHAGAAGLFSQQDQKPYLNQAECWRARVGGSRGKGQHGESADATTSSWVDESVARTPFIDTTLLCNFDRVRLTQRYCPREARSWSAGRGRPASIPPGRLALA